MSLAAYRKFMGFPNFSPLKVPAYYKWLQTKTSLLVILEYNILEYSYTMGEHLE